MNQPAVEFDDVTCSFVSDDNKHYTAVRDVNLTIGDGEFVERRRSHRHAVNRPYLI